MVVENTPLPPFDGASENGLLPVRPGTIRLRRSPGWLIRLVTRRIFCRILAEEDPLSIPPPLYDFPSSVRNAAI